MPQQTTACDQNVARHLPWRKSSSHPARVNAPSTTGGRNTASEPSPPRIRTRGPQPRQTSRTAHRTTLSCSKRPTHFRESAMKVCGNTARRQAWIHCFGFAHRTSGTMGSGGCAVLAKRGAGISDRHNRTVSDLVSHRVTVAWVSAIAKGGFHLISIYLKDSVSMNHENKLVCEHVCAIARCLEGPCIIGGDWNMEPSTLAHSGFLAMVRGTFFASEHPTCNGKVFNFFVVTNNFVHAVAGVQRINGVGTEPHFPDLLSTWRAVRNLRRPKRVPPVLMHGLQPEPPSYASVAANANAIPCRLQNSVADSGLKTKLNEAATEWIKLAREELNTIAFDDLSFKVPRFSWQSADAKVASPWDATSTLTAAWRGFAKRAFEAVAILSKWKVDESQRRTVAKHVAVLVNSTELVPKTARADLEQHFKNFADSFAAAVKRQSCTWLLPLCKLAKKESGKARGRNLGR